MSRNTDKYITGKSGTSTRSIAEILASLLKVKCVEQFDYLYTNKILFISFPTSIRPSIPPPYFSHTSCHSLLLTPSISTLALFLLLCTAFLLAFLSLLHSLPLFPFHHQLSMLEFSDSKPNMQI